MPILPPPSLRARLIVGGALLAWIGVPAVIGAAVYVSSSSRPLQGITEIALVVIVAFAFRPLRESLPAVSPPSTRSVRTVAWTFAGLGVILTFDLVPMPIDVRDIPWPRLHDAEVAGYFSLVPALFAQVAVLFARLRTRPTSRP